uniref:Metalloendopeptidase n=1 Tax=Macrostomum lignano TaxID=282301 RepID=A0A1I8FH63_9PLAT
SALDEDDVRILRRNGVLDGKEPPASAKKATTAEELQAHLGQFADIDSDLLTSATTPRPRGRRPQTSGPEREQRGRRRRMQRGGRRPAGGRGGRGGGGRRKERRRQRRRQRRRAATSGAATTAAAPAAGGSAGSGRVRRAAAYPERSVSRFKRAATGRQKAAVAARSKQQALFKLAMRQWENVSCIRSPPWTAAAAATSAEKGGVQSVSIGKNCDKLGIVMHELGHVIGFWHEHTRPDRDKYIEIIEENILESQKYNFKVLTSMDVDSLGEPYDFDSIMHYARSTFRHLAEPGTPCGRCSAARGPTSASGPTSQAGDIGQVHKLYGCRKCGGSLLQESGEFGSAAATSELSSGSGGAVAVARFAANGRSRPRAGEKVQIDIKWLDIQAEHNRNCVWRTTYLEIRTEYYRGSPLLDLQPQLPSAYRGDKECIWKIEVPNGYSVALKFFSFELETHTQCVYDFVEVLEGWSQDGGVSLGKFCGETVPKPVKSTGNRMTVRFKSDNSVNKIGFAATFEKARVPAHLREHAGRLPLRLPARLPPAPRRSHHCEDTCGGTLVAMRGTVTSPSYPGQVPPNKHCKWHIIAPPSGTRFCSISPPLISKDAIGGEIRLPGHLDGVDEATRNESAVYCGDPASRVSKGGFSASFMVDAGTKCAMMNGGCDQLCKNTIGSYVGYVLYGNHQCKEGGCKHRITRLSASSPAPTIPAGTRWKSGDAAGTSSPRRAPHQNWCSSSFEIERHPDCAYDHVEIRDGPDATSERIGVFCGDAMPPTPVISTGNSILRRAADRLVRERASFYSHAGFGDKDYGTRENCNWTLTTSNPEEVIVLNMETFELESEIECGYDYVDIFDDDNDRGVLLGRYCGNLRER